MSFCRVRKTKSKKKKIGKFEPALLHICACEPHEKLDPVSKIQIALCVKFKFFVLHSEYIAKIINTEIKIKGLSFSIKVTSFNYPVGKEVYNFWY